MKQVGDYLNEWVRCPELPGADGERQHLFFAVIVGASDSGRALVDRDVPLACGLPIDNPMVLDDAAQKCERCCQIADGDMPSARDDVPAPREREPVAA